MTRTRAYRREVRNKAIARKKRIAKQYWPHVDWYPCDGMYSKGKIHCSCKSCTFGKYFGLLSLKDEIDKLVVKDALSEL